MPKLGGRYGVLPTRSGARTRLPVDQGRQAGMVAGRWAVATTASGQGAVGGQARVSF